MKEITSEIITLRHTLDKYSTFFDNSIECQPSNSNVRFKLLEKFRLKLVVSSIYCRWIWDRTVLRLNCLIFRSQNNRIASKNPPKSYAFDHIGIDRFSGQLYCQNHMGMFGFRRWQSYCQNSSDSGNFQIDFCGIYTHGHFNVNWDIYLYLFLPLTLPLSLSLSACMLVCFFVSNFFLNLNWLIRMRLHW